MSAGFDGFFIGEIRAGIKKKFVSRELNIKFA